MPNLDKTGPTGDGPTGLRRGECVGGGDTDALPRGRGFGRRWCPYFAEPKLSLDEEEKLLKERLQEIQETKESK